MSPGVCGCGVADTDTDSDGTPDCNDQCLSDPNKLTPGACGCGAPDLDIDGDGTPSCTNPPPVDIPPVVLDLCPEDPSKIVLGLCGCGVAETDSDGDSTPDCLDSCAQDPNRIAPTAEICNGQDDNCDGDIDESFGLGDVCTTGVGACAVVGAYQCDSEGGVVCSAVALSPGTEICNGIDDDCDGEIDEGDVCNEKCSSSNASQALHDGLGSKIESQFKWYSRVINKRLSKKNRSSMRDMASLMNQYHMDIWRMAWTEIPTEIISCSEQSYCPSQSIDVLIRLDETYRNAIADFRLMARSYKKRAPRRTKKILKWLDRFEEKATTLVRADLSKAGVCGASVLERLSTVVIQPAGKIKNKKRRRK